MIPFDQPVVEGDRLLSPFMQLLDTRVEEWRQGYVKLSAELKPEFTNINGDGHGGFIMTLMDAALSMSGFWTAPDEPPKRALTLAMTTQFLSVLSTPRCTIIGELERSGRSIFFSKSTVLDSNDQIVATAQANFKIIYKKQ